MSTALIPYAPSLFDLEQNLESLFDTEAFVTDEQEAEFRLELSSALEASIEKRDRVGQFIRHCQMQQQNCEDEMDRLQARRKSFAAAEERMRKYVHAVITSLGRDSKGKTKKLEGKTITFSLRPTPGSVEISDAEAVPDDYKKVTVTLPADTWTLLCDEMRDDDNDPLWFEMQRANERASKTISKTAVKQAIDAGVEVPGADLTIGGYSLVVK